MRYAALFFPRLAIQLARRTNPELGARPLGLISGEGDAGLLSAVSVEATADGVEPGMTPLQARQRCSGIMIEPDNARTGIETLESLVTILKARTTTNVAIVSRNEIVVSLEGMEAQFADEGAAALGLAGIARSWTMLDVRTAVASTIEEASCAARRARRFPAICPLREDASANLPVYEPIAASFGWEAPASAAVAESRLARMVSGLSPAFEAYGQSYREVRIELEHGPYRRTLVLRPDAPLLSAVEALRLIRGKVDPAGLEGVTSLRVVCAAPGPSVEILPWRAPVARFHELSGPAVPIQRRLLRAS
jgi:hypothetical protein